MTTIPTLTYPQSDEQVIPPSLTTPLSAAADLFETADRCAALVSVLIETDDRSSRTALCERLLHALRQLRELCDADLPPHLLAHLIQGETLTSCMPDCWQDTAPQVDYALALVQAILGGTLPASVEKELAGLLHDLVWLLNEFVKEPYISVH
ncbi:hypothetical protein MXM41_15840 [Leclercia adecarboxylata]|uniref:hypothetical protein n=1 Tax=Leclercia adecarboxylata TaxID=83655 RepID=UPI002DB9998B|nr:hypothetical protein [Leclercia adecarboxylata]MEB6380391.1 hypothetical protein [Leclercia adecarboxylata]